MGWGVAEGRGRELRWIEPSRMIYTYEIVKE